MLNLHRLLSGSFTELKGESICCSFDGCMQILCVGTGTKQRKNVRECNPGEKGDSANMAPYSAADLNHRYFSHTATKMDGYGFYRALPVLLASLVCQN